MMSSLTIIDKEFWLSTIIDFFGLWFCNAGKFFLYLFHKLFSKFSLHFQDPIQIFLSLFPKFIFFWIAVSHTANKYRVLSNVHVKLTLTAPSPPPGESQNFFILLCTCQQQNCSRFLFSKLNLFLKCTKSVL